MATRMAGGWRAATVGHWLGLLAATMVALSSGAAAVTFTPHYTDAQGQGFYDPILGAARRSAFEFSLSIWSSRLPSLSTVNIDVYASFEPMGGSRTSAVLGTGGPASFVADFTGTLRSNTAYPSALANFLSNRDLNGGRAEIDIRFNSDLDNLTVLGANGWYYGLGLDAPRGDIGFVSVAVHELTHSMGFISTFNADGTSGVSVGSKSLPAIFDRYLVNGNGTRLLDLVPRGSNVTSPVYWSGTMGTQAYRRQFGTGRPRMYAPPTFAADSSLSHLDEAVFTGDYDLMTPFADRSIHAPDDVTRGIMADLGWRNAGFGDADLDGHVDVLDLFTVANRMGRSFGMSGYAGGADLNGDGTIDAVDLGLVVSHFGRGSFLDGLPTAASWVGSGQMVWLPGLSRALYYEAVPEPSSLVLVGLAAFGTLCRRWRR